MANVFDNLAAEVPNSLTTIYTCPAGKTTIVMTLQVSNIDGNDRTVDAQVIDNSVTDTGYLCKNFPIPANTAVNILGGKLILKPGDEIKMSCSAASACDYNMSYMEKS